MELTCTNYRLLKYVLFGWVTVTQKWKRVRKRGDAHRRALVFRGASLLSRMFHAWSRASSRRRRKKEACERYTLLVFKISFYLWKTTSLESARIRRRASRMRGDRVLKAVIHNWREFVRIKCVDIPQRVLSVLRLRMLFGHWRTLKRVLLLKTTVFDSALWKVKRTANVFKKWLFLLVRKRSIQKACHMLQRCKDRYRLRCSLLRWEGWEEERLAQRLWSSLQDRRLKPIATVTLNGSLINSWEQHILSWRWREGAVANESSDDGYQEIVKYHELMMTTEADSESAEAQSRLHHLFSASTGVSRRPNRHELINRIGEPEKKEKANTREKGYHGSLSSLKSVQKKDSTKSFSCKKIHSQNIRCSILDRALLLGYCNYRPESHAPLLKCLKAILQAFRKIVRKRRHSHVAYIYYRNNRHHATVSSSFHFWISKIPELSHRSSSWLHSLPEGRPLLSVS